MKLPAGMWPGVGWVAGGRRLAVQSVVDPGCDGGRWGVGVASAASAIRDA